MKLLGRIRGVEDHPAKSHASGVIPQIQRSERFEALFVNSTPHSEFSLL